MWLAGSCALGFIQNPNDLDLCRRQNESTDWNQVKQYQKQFPSIHKIDLFHEKVNFHINFNNFLLLASASSRINPHAKGKLIYDIKNIPKFLLDFVDQDIWRIKPKRLYQFELIYHLVRQYNPEHIVLTSTDKDLINQLHDCSGDINYEAYLAERCKTLTAVLPS